MGKKKNKKKNQNYYDMTPEEQMANAEFFNDLEKGEVSFLDSLNYKVATAPKNQSSLIRQIEEACFGFESNKTKTNEENYFSEQIEENLVKSCSNIEVEEDTTEEEEGYISYSKLMSVDALKTETKCVTEVSDTLPKQAETKADSDINNIPRIHFSYEGVTGRMLIDDGLISTPVSVCCTSSLDLNDEYIPTDADAFGELMSKFFYYIIACKHPAVIVSEETFEIEFSVFSKINFNRFVFFKNNGYVYAYVIDEGEVDNFYHVTGEFKMTDEDSLKYVIGTAFAAGSIHNVFMHDDEDEVDSVMNARHDIKKLLKLIENDPATEYAGHNVSGDTLSNMKVTDLSIFITDIRQLLEQLTDVEDDEEENDDEYDDEEYDENIDQTDDESDEDDYDDIDINDFPDIDLKTNTDNIDDMIEEIEPSENIRFVKTVESSIETKTTTVVTPNNNLNDNDTGDMVLPIIHRR